MKVLLSAYACEPDRGSEPAVGWNWAMEMAKYVDVVVLTRANNEELISEKLQTYKEAGKKDLPTFLYHDPPWLCVTAKKKGVLPVQLFYILWQIGAFFKVRRTLESYDIVHHVTFNSMMSPGFWWSKKTPTILGPLGGSSIVRNDYKVLFGARLRKELLREWMIKHWEKLPWLRFSFSRSSMILCANSETQSYIASKYPLKVRNFLETGIQRESIAVPNNGELSNSGIVRLIWVGSVEPWKALSLGLRAYAKALSSLPEARDIILDVVGTGSELSESKKEAESLNLDGKVCFHGVLPLSETQELMKSSDVLLFTSVKDTSGNVVLEAMAQAKPVICLNHQGVKDMATEETAIKVAPGSIEDTIDGLASAIMKLANDPQLRLQMGNEGRQRVLDVYSWEEKAKLMKDCYDKVLS